MRVPPNFGEVWTSASGCAHAGQQSLCKLFCVLFRSPFVWETWKCQGFWQLSGKVAKCCLLLVFASVRVFSSIQLVPAWWYEYHLTWTGAVKCQRISQCLESDLPTATLKWPVQRWEWRVKLYTHTYIAIRAFQGPHNFLICDVLC